MYIPFTRKKINVFKLITLLKKPLAFQRQRLFLWRLVIPVCLLSACSSYIANAKNYPISPQGIDSQFMQINILNSFLLKTRQVNNLPVVELSDLAWDEDEQLLYAISDQGLLYHLKLRFNDSSLTSLEDIQFVNAMPLTDKNKVPLKGRAHDSEVLQLINGNNGKRGDSQLIISFENKPRIAVHNTKGHFIKKIKIAKKLKGHKRYRGGNKALESVTVHPELGILTASEQPLNAKPITIQTVYSSKGKEWSFKASSIKNSSITAIETMPNNKLLILERAYNGIFSPIVISLRELNLKDCGEKILCNTKPIATFDSSEGWTVDNFEGLTRVRDNLYLMVSDNNKNPLQKTLMVFFEVLTP